MVLSRLLANETVVGVDVGSNSIKVVCSEPDMRGARITHAAMCPTPPGSVKEGVVVNIPEVAAAIQFALRSAGIKATSAIGAIAGPGVVVRQIQLPKMTEQVLRKSIYFEAGKHISASIEDSIVEFEILGDADDPAQMNVLIVASPKAMIESRVSALEQAGLEPLAVDIEAFATFRSLISHNPAVGCTENTIALLDIGASHAEINLVSKGKLELTRTIPIAGSSLTNVVKNTVHCTEEEAEQLKCAIDLSGLVEQMPDSTTDPQLKALQSLVDEMLREIRRSINYYQSQLPDGTEASVNKLVLTGGTANLKGIVPYTASRLKVEVEIGMPGGGMSESSQTPLSDEDMPLFSIAFGLAVKEMPPPACLEEAA